MWMIYDPCSWQGTQKHKDYDIIEVTWFYLNPNLIPKIITFPPILQTPVELHRQTKQTKQTQVVYRYIKKII